MLYVVCCVLQVVCCVLRGVCCMLRVCAGSLRHVRPSEIAAAKACSRSATGRRNATNATNATPTVATAAPRRNAKKTATAPRGQRHTRFTHESLHVVRSRCTLQGARRVLRVAALQHGMQRCNTKGCDAKHCAIKRRNAIRCNAKRCYANRCNTCNTNRCNTKRCDAKRCDAKRCDARDAARLRNGISAIGERWPIAPSDVPK